jgi:hypothetical protein
MTFGAFVPAVHFGIAARAFASLMRPLQTCRLGFVSSGSDSFDYERGSYRSPNSQAH